MKKIQAIVEMGEMGGLMDELTDVGIRDALAMPVRFHGRRIGSGKMIKIEIPTACYDRDDVSAAMRVIHAHAVCKICEGRK